MSDQRPINWKSTTNKYIESAFQIQYKFYYLAMEYDPLIRIGNFIAVLCIISEHDCNILSAYYRSNKKKSYHLQYYFLNTILGQYPMRGQTVLQVSEGKYHCSGLSFYCFKILSILQFP